ncbi:MAG: cation diffusion facilitator family transporter [Methanobacterium sp.]|jgi:cation diffusion facilitator family transporter
MNNESRNNLRRGQVAAKYSSIVQLGLAISKGLVGFFTGSIALIADAFHSFSDIFISLAVYIGLKLSQRKPTEKFPYGYYKVETFISLIISAIIIFSGIEIIQESIDGIMNPTAVRLPLFALAIAAISAFVSLLISRYKERIGIEIGSQALINDGRQSFIDVFTSIIVFIGIFSSYLGYPIFQGVAGFIVSLFVSYIGIKLGKDAVLVLLDVSLDDKTVNEIKSTALSVEDVKNIHNLKVRRSGPFVFAELHLETKRGLSVKKASEITENVKKAVKDRIKNLDSLTVQIEPFKKKKLRVAVPIEDKNGLQSEISEHFARAPYILIVDVVNGEITDIVIKDNPGTKLEKKKGIKTAEFLGKEQVDVLIGSEVGEGPTYVLSDKLIDVMAPRGRNLEEIILNVYK